MKKLLLLIVLCAGCDTEIHWQKSVNKAFPGADIVEVPNQQSYFIVRDTNGAIWFVSGSSSGEAIDTVSAKMLEAR